MNEWDTDKIIGAGLIVVALSAVVGSVVVTLCTGSEAANYKNMYEAYHALGKNGVMDGIYEEFLKIPVRPDAEVYPNEQIGGAA